jgi:hypothetical protein
MPITQLRRFASPRKLGNAYQAVNKLSCRRSSTSSFLGANDVEQTDRSSSHNATQIPLLPCGLWPALLRRCANLRLAQFLATFAVSIVFACTERAQRLSRENPSHPPSVAFACLQKRLPERRPQTSHKLASGRLTSDWPLSDQNEPDCPRTKSFELNQLLSIICN